MATKPKTYSVLEASRETGYHYQWIARLCQAGKIGVRIDIPENGQHFYRISGKEIQAIKAAKRQGLRQSCKQS
jgi:hypothetical protein